jgi:hypothetical protein
MTDVFLDTVGMIAVWDDADQWHARAQAAYEIRELVLLEDLEVLLVRVPGIVIDLNAVPEQVPGHIHEPHSYFNQFAGD